MTHKVYTGPTIVKQTADRLRASGLTVTLEGTDRVYVEANDFRTVLAALKQSCCTGWSNRDIREATL